jgi:chemotaxis protein CheD
VSMSTALRHQSSSLAAVQSRVGKRHHVLQGEFFVTDDPEILLTTVLGSCVAACIRDPRAGVGGMNHFLLPGAMERAGEKEAQREGVHMMELLLNGLFQRGARRQHLEARLFGGANMFAGLSEIGRQNAAFAESFLGYEGIRVVRGSLGGNQGRRVEFWPVSGVTRAQSIKAAEAPVPVPVAPAPKGNEGRGDVELF